MSTDLPVLLLQGFRHLVDGLHSELAVQGHPDVRPVHGFVLQAVADGCPAVELGRRLGVSKQAAAEHVEILERLGYPARSAAIFGALRAGWPARIGEDRVATMEADLRTVDRGCPAARRRPGVARPGVRRPGLGEPAQASTVAGVRRTGMAS